MANITVRKDGPTAPLAPTAEPRWESFRMMRDLLAWDPFREMMPYASLAAEGFAPSFEIKETKDSYIFKADVPA